jgi:fatty acid desaturase
MAFRPTQPRSSDFDQSNNAYAELSRTIRARGLLNRSRGFYITLLVVLGLGLLATFAGMILLGESWFQLLLAGALGLLFTQFAFLAHEASHRQVFASGRTNDRMGKLLATLVVGMSYSWWMSKHTRHHKNPNQVDADPDIEYDTIAFTPESAAEQHGFKAWIVQRQGWLFFPLLLLEGINLHYISIRTLVTDKSIKGRWLELAMILARVTAVVFILFWFLPVGMAFAFLGVQLAVFGLYMGASFAPNHKGMPIIPAGSRLDFLRKQVLTSRNVRGGWWATWLFGGLNYQIEHHLFPSMPRPHLAKTRRIVREYCLSIGVPYTETSLMRSYAIVIEYLNRVGLSARDSFDCPMVDTYRR